MVAAIAGKRIGKKHDLAKPQGVRGRNSDNTRLREVLGWEPRVTPKRGRADPTSQRAMAHEGLIGVA